MAREWVIKQLDYTRLLGVSGITLEINWLSVDSET